MIVPLALTTLDDEWAIVANSIVHRAPLPVPLEIAIKDPRNPSGVRPETWSDPATGQTIPVGIVSRRSETSYDDLLRSREMRRCRVHALPVLEQLYVRAESHYLAHPQTRPLRCLYLDIEVGSSGGALFPRPDRSPVLLIGYAVDDGPIQILDPGPDIQDDRALLGQWIDVVAAINPDVIVTYYGRKFDIPFLLKRCALHELDVTPLKRIPDGADPFEGRVHLDLFLDGVVKDTSQTLMGEPDRKMKTVARAYKLSTSMELDDADLRDMLGVWVTPDGPARLRQYLTSDVEIARGLTPRYLREIEALADHNRVPLSAMVDTYKSFIPKLVHARHFHRLKLACFETNYERYNGGSGTLHRLGRMEEERGRLRYEGGKVEILKAGQVLSPVWKIDYGSFYPSTFRTLNLSPETTRIVELRDYTGQFRIERTKTKLWLDVPDDNFRKQIVIQVDQDHDGFLRGDIAAAMEQRIVLKRQARQLDPSDPQYPTIDAQQNARKVLLNSLYGMEGQVSSEYGSLPCAIACVGMCRWLITRVRDELGSALAELDTDGCYVDQVVDVDRLNQRIHQELVQAIGHPGYVTLELEKPWVAGIFYKMKNYILQDDQGRITLHGGTFKNATHSRGAKRLLRRLAEVELAGGDPDARAEALRTDGDPWTWSFDDFIASLTFRKNPDAYMTYRNIHTSLAEQVAYLEQRPPEESDQLEYVHTIEPWTIRTGQDTKSKTRQNVTIRPLAGGIDEIDREYYVQQVERILGRFGLSTQTIVQRPLF